MCVLSAVYTSTSVVVSATYSCWVLCQSPKPGDSLPCSARISLPRFTILWSFLFWSMADECVLKFCSHSGNAFCPDPAWHLHRRSFPWETVWNQSPLCTFSVVWPCWGPGYPVPLWCVPRSWEGHASAWSYTEKSLTTSPVTVLVNSACWWSRNRNCAPGDFCWFCC